MTKKMMRMSRKTLAMLLALMMILGVLSSVIPVFASAEVETIAGWSAPTSAATSHDATTGTGALTHSTGSSINLSSTGYNPTAGGSWSWVGDNGQYWQLSGILAGEFADLSISLGARSSATGPRDFKVFYSTDGLSFLPATDAEVDYRAGNAGWLNNQTISLPAGASNSASLSLRFVNITNLSARAGTGTFSETDTVASTGTSQINNIIITGIKGGEVLTPAAAPTASPPGGEAILGITPITLATTTEDASIHFTLDGSTPSSQSRQYTGPFTIDFTSGRSVTVRAIAIADGYANSNVASFVYSMATKEIPFTSWTAPTEAAISHAATTGTGALTHSTGSSINLSSTGYNPSAGSSWQWADDEGRFWQLTGINATKLTNLSISVNARSSGTGPRDFKVFYSTDGVNYHPATDNDVDYIAGNAAWNYGQTIRLPFDVSYSSSLSLRFVNITNLSARAGTGTNSPTDAVASGGTSQINNIIISGTHVDGCFDCGFAECECEPADCDECGICDDCIDCGECGICEDCIDCNECGICEDCLDCGECGICEDCTPDVGPVVVPISEAIEQPLSTVVTVEGVLVYNIRNAAGASDNGVYMQDDSGAGINIRPGSGSLSSTAVRNLIGQKVRVTGEIGNFSGLVQLQNRQNSSPQLFQLEVIDANPIIPEPVPISIQEISAFTNPFSLVSLEDVQLISKNDTFPSGHSSYTIERDGVRALLYGPATLWNNPANPDSGPFRAGDWITITRAVMSSGGFTATANTNHIYMNPDSLGDIIFGVEPPPPGEREEIAAWRSPTATDVITATGGEYREDSTLRIVGTAATNLNWANAAINRAGGFDGREGSAYWLFTTSSEDYKDIRINFSLRSSGTGPRDFLVQYSTDGEIWRNALNPDVRVGNALGINDDRSHFSATLPVGANGAEKLYIRIVLASNIAPNGSPIGSGGSNSINNIFITGEYVPNANQLALPRTNTLSGDVPFGYVITFTRDPRDVDVEGYTVMVSENGGVTWKEATDGKYTLTVLPTTIHVRAEAPDMDPSRTISFNFEHAKLPLVTASRNSGAVIPGATIRLDNEVNEVVIKYQINDGEVLDYTEALVLADVLFVGTPATLSVRTWAEKPGYITGDASVYAYTKATVGGEGIYFGQIHNHTTLSDGRGEIEEAYAFARDVAGLDFFAVTDHSNSFVHVDPVNTDPTLIDLNTHNATSPSWVRSLAAAADAYRENEFISLLGFEMTWSGGPGHINTYNTGGFVSRNNTFLNNKVDDAGLRAYYELLKRTPNSISLFAHPGPTFGNFNNFAYHDPVLNQRITLIEVGNGEGPVSSGGYWRSYDQYILALDKGWKLAPVNNQDTHNGIVLDASGNLVSGWGDSNTTRTAIWTNDLSMAGVYQAFRDMRVYATEVEDLRIEYSVNGQPLGETLDVVPPVANFVANINSPTAGNVIKSVALVTNGGVRLLEEFPNSQNHVYNKTIDTPAPGYYFLWVVVSTPRGDRIAVTAPVWLGQGKLAGFNDVSINTEMPVTTEKLDLTANLFNNEPQAATILSLRYVDQTGTILFEDDNFNTVLAANNGAVSHTIEYTPTAAGNATISVTARIEFADGEIHTFRADSSFVVRDINRLVFIGVDASHNNAYVAGQYRDAIGNFINLAADHDVRTVILRTEAELIAATENDKFVMLALSSPDRHTSVATHLSYSEAVVEAVAKFAAAGNTVLINGLGNWNEQNSRLAPIYENTIAGNQNRLLSAIGSHIRVSEDSAYDTVKNRAGQHTPLLNEPDNYELDHPLLTGVIGTQTYSTFSGSSLYIVDGSGAVVRQLEDIPASVSPMVWGNATTFSSNENQRSWSQQGGIRYGSQADEGRGTGRLVLAASEEVKFENGNTATIIVTNAVIHSDFEVREPDNAAQLPNSNFNISRNIIRGIAPEPVIISVPDARELQLGTSVVVEGIVTSNVNANNNEINTGFFDSIYIQDDNGGINLFPVSEGVELGQKVRVYGSISEFMGERQIAVERIIVIDSSINLVAPTAVSTAEAMSSETIGLLVSISGVVSNVVTGNDGTISQFIVTDESNVGALVFINAYITSLVDLSFVEAGATVSVVGLASFGENASGDPVSRIRVRDRNEIILISAPTTPQQPGTGNGGTGGGRGPGAGVGNTGDAGTEGGAVGGTGAGTGAGVGAGGGAVGGTGAGTGAGTGGTGAGAGGTGTGTGAGNETTPPLAQTPTEDITDDEDQPEEIPAELPANQGAANQGTGDDLEIGDQEVPLASGYENPSVSPWIFITILAASCLALFIGLRGLLLRKKRDD